MRLTKRKNRHTSPREAVAKDLSVIPQKSGRAIEYFATLSLTTPLRLSTQKKYYGQGLVSLRRGAGDGVNPLQNLGDRR